MVKTIWASFCVMLLGATVIFYIFQRGISNMLLDLALQSNVQTFLSASMEDQRRLAELHPQEVQVYRARFESIKALRDNYLILEHSRTDMGQNFELALMSLLGTIILGSTGIYFWQHRRQARRLERLQTYLVALSEGRTDIVVADQGHDLLGRIGSMIEKTSRVLARQRQRLTNLDALSAWQEAARRHAHEIRTPLTAARMELGAMTSYVCKHAPELASRTRQLEQSVNEELDHLKEFTAAFTSFAKIGKPKLAPTVLHEMLARFSERFSEAWAHLTIRLEPGHEALVVDLDKDMVRQVLVNLCNNSALAIEPNTGVVSLKIAFEGEYPAVDVSDNGPGIPAEIRASVFKPYTTSRKIGEGMGLGLSIAQKIMLDHGGDLVLKDTGPAGTCFRLIFPRSKEDLDTWQ